MVNAPVTNRPTEKASSWIRSQEKGVLAKGVSVETSVTAKETKNTQGCWPQQYIWHSERHSREKGAFCKNPLLKTPFSWFLMERLSNGRTFRRDQF